MSDTKLILDIIVALWAWDIIGNLRKAFDKPKP